MLIALVLFNTMGYYGFLLGMQYHNNQKQIATLNKESENLKETVTLKIPLAIPYASEWHGYERVDGVFEYKDKFLRLVKQRFYGDTLEIICVRDVQHEKINNAFVEHARSMGDDTNAPHSKDIQVIKEYTATTFSISSIAGGWSLSIEPSYLIEEIHPIYLSSIIQPPEVI
ncbi:MAG: hypothetical protein WDO14_09770 [Bacteroidota bacterium]